MDFLTPEFLSGLAAIVLLDLVLAGDNAIVIALAARNLPRHLQKKAVFWGTFGAIAIRILLTFAVIWLLKLPGLMLAGGLLLLPIAWKLLKHEEHDPDISPASGFWSAIRTIVVADALMGLDNVLAIAGAAKGHMGLVILGLAISVPLVVWGSTLILRLIERFPVIVYIGAGAIAWTAARMMAHDHLLAPWFEARPWAPWLLDVLLVAGICGGGWLYTRRRQAAA
ncbi:integral membrane protein, YjbE family [Luteibacter sp. UNC138MFCol5.1]|uniref:TerC family protein n=1 Tax=Luteibacter sp. UNC138MFCol5.1 TaxID=1502774 RepID=UPI0008C703DA|nr:TerC family protein [Luteibacter sp. UNC138MFCol5.1]SEP13411.1 integral membrane protein, YjbE family [Luteibacter sp. UNC138MFCol5.1]